MSASASAQGRVTGLVKDADGRQGDPATASVEHQAALEADPASVKARAALDRLAR